MGLVAVPGNDVILVSGDTEPRLGLITEQSWSNLEDDPIVNLEDVHNHVDETEPKNANVNVQITLQDRKAFNSFEEVEDFMKAYQNQNRTAFSLRTNTKRGRGSVRWVCKHGAARKSRSLNIRPNQSTVKQGCEAYVNFYRKVDGTYNLTTCNEEHSNHDITDEMYLQDTAKVGEEHNELIETLMEGRSKAGQIADVLETRHGQRLNTKQIRYRMNQLRGPNRENEKLEELLNTVEAEGGTVKVLRDDQGFVQCLAVATSAMVSAFRGSNPSVANIDTTFKFENSGHKLSAAAYLNPVTGKGEIAQFMFLADECDETYQFAYESFKDLCLRDVPVLIVDKVGILFF